MIRRCLANLAHLWWIAAYWIRPYDLLADRRRWRWQKPLRCAVIILDEETYR